MSPLARILNRSLALVLLAGVVAAVLFILVLPLLEWRQAKLEDLAHNRDMVSRLYLSSSASGNYEEQIETLAEKIRNSDLFIRGETEPLAAAAIQEHIKDIIADNGGDLRSVQSLETEEEDGVIRIRVKVLMNSPHEAFVNVLHALEAGEPYLFVEALEIATSAGGRGALRGGGEIKLAVDLEVYGYLAPELPG
jgi:hypothetical protein